MGYNLPDVYHQPESFGLRIIGSIEWDMESYQFNITVILRGDDGQWYHVSDSGCSCPSPFENVTTIDGLTKVTFPELVAYLTDRLKEYKKDYDDEDGWRDHDPSTDATRLLELIHQDQNTIKGEVV